MSEQLNDDASLRAAWIVAILAVLGSTGWLLWEWISRPTDLATARVYVDGKAWDRAVKMLEGIVAARPDDSEVKLLLGYCYSNLQQHEDAAKVLLSIRNDAEQRASALLFAGQSLLKVHRRRAAESALKQALEIDESFPGVADTQHECRRELCGLMFAEGRRRELFAISQEMYERSLPKDRHIPLSHRMRSLVRNVEPNAGLRLLEPALEVDPGDHRTRAATALYLADVEKYDDALQRISECRNADPNDLFFWEAWCQILYRKGDFESIAKAVESIPPGAEESAVAAHAQSVAAEHRGDLTQAVKHLNRAMALDPDPGSHQRMARLLAKMRRPDEAKRELEIVRTTQPVIGEVQEFLEKPIEGEATGVRHFADWASQAAEFMERLERVDEARRWRIAALAADPNHRPSLAALERDAVRRYGRQ